VPLVVAALLVPLVWHAARDRPRSWRPFARDIIDDGGWPTRENIARDNRSIMARNIQLVK